jgi:hypothetical protein
MRSVLLDRAAGADIERPPERRGRGHPIHAGRVLVGSIACACGEHRLTWECDCGSMSYGPVLGPDCWVLNGPARVR